MDYFTAVRRRENVKAMEESGEIADSMEVRLAIVNRIHAGEITLTEGQAELKRIKRNAKKSGKMTRDQAFRS